MRTLNVVVAVSQLIWRVMFYVLKSIILKGTLEILSDYNWCLWHAWKANSRYYSLCYYGWEHILSYHSEFKLWFAKCYNFGQSFAYFGGLILYRWKIYIPTLYRYFHKGDIISLKSATQAGEMVQWLRALTALPEVLSWVPSNHMVVHNHL